MGVRLSTKPGSGWRPADLLNGGSPHVEDPGLDELDLSDADSASSDEDDKAGSLLGEEEEEERAAERHAAKRSRLKDEAALLPTEDRYALCLSLNKHAPS